MIVTILLAATATRGQIASPDAKRAERVAALIEWVKGPEGRSSTLAATAVSGLRLGQDALPVRRKGYQDDDTNVAYVVSLLQLDGKEVYVLYRTTSVDSTLWRVGRSGAIEDVLQLTQTSLVHSTDPHLSRLEETLDYLEGQQQRRSIWKQNPTAAVAYFDRRIRAHPTDADAWEGRCWVRTMIGHLKDALSDCAESFRLKPNVGLSARSLAYLRSGELDKALADFGKSFEIRRTA